VKFPTPERTERGGKFLTLGNGKSVIGVFRGEIGCFYQAFIGGKYVDVPSTDANGTFRFQINVIINENGELVPKIFQGNYFDFQALQELNEQFPLESTYMKISQTGERQSKRISFVPQTKAKPDENKIKHIMLLPVKKSESTPDMPSYFNDGPPYDEEIPF